MTARLLCLGLAALLAGSALACAPGGPPACARAYRVGLAAGIDPVAAEAAKGLDQAARAHPGCVETRMAAELDSLAGYDLVVTIGQASMPQALAAARANPQSRYAVLGAAVDEPPLPNVLGVAFRDEQAIFMAGALAALVSGSRLVAGVYGLSSEATARRQRAAFEAGVAAADAGVAVRGVHQPPGPAFEGRGWAEGIAREQVAQGADVLFGSAGDRSLGVLAAGAQLAAVPGRPPVYCLGVGLDAYYAWPAYRACLLSSAMPRHDVATRLLVGLLVRGRLPPRGPVVMDLRNGGVGLAPYHDFDTRVSPGVRSRLAATASQAPRLLAGIG